MTGAETLSTPGDAPWHSAEPCPVVALTFLTRIRYATKTSDGKNNGGMQSHQEAVAQLQAHLNLPHKGEISLPCDLHFYISASDFAWPV